MSAASASASVSVTWALLRAIDWPGRRPVVNAAGPESDRRTPELRPPLQCGPASGRREVSACVRGPRDHCVVCVRRFACHFDDCRQTTVDDRLRASL